MEIAILIKITVQVCAVYNKNILNMKIKNFKRRKIFIQQCTPKKSCIKLVQQHTPAIPDIQKAGAGESEVADRLGNSVRPSIKNKRK